ncbi:putative glycerol-3-phosphate 2-O-acyltransferase 6-like [Capsicum annuum]|nr:putative glycerol-3-phosphate 2-O-acyltransferase 6-like [Capsicum annuum]KAF3663610.1 putative glycerol-3-phosphate 2-O-acyltransferase 6-like [Capsicum annuum]
MELGWEEIGFQVLFVGLDQLVGEVVYLVLDFEGYLELGLCCIIFENGFTILSFDGKIIGRTRENPSFYHSVSLTVVVLLDGVYGVGGRDGGDGGHRGSIGGGCLWWLPVVSVVVVFVALVGNVCGGGCWNIMKIQNIDRLFKRNCSGCFIEVLEDPSARFQMRMVYDLLKHRIKYVGDDNDSEEGSKKMDEIWINYCGMPICFGLKKFGIVTGLRYHRPEEPPISKENPHKISKASRKTNKQANKVIENDLLACAEDFDKFKNYPWGYDNFYLIIQYLLTKLSLGTTRLDGFPWDFMARAFEAIPSHRKKVMDYPDEVSHPRIFRWLAAKNNPKIKEADLFKPPNDAVVHPWIVPAEQELVMTFFITLGHVDTIADPTVEVIKKELDGSTTIRRTVRQGQPNVEALYDQSTKVDPGASSGGVVGVGGRHVDAATTRDDEHYKESQDKLFEKVEAISKVVEEFKSKRGSIPSKKVREPYTPTTAARRKKRAIIDYPEAYDIVDRIVYHDFCKKLKDKYDQLDNQASSCGVGFNLLVSMLDWDKEEMIKYVRGERPNPHGKSWTKAKRILAVINVDDIHYWAVQILLEKGKIKVYDCNEPCIDEVVLFIHVQLLIKLFPILLRESKLMNHLPEEVLMKKSWDFEG